MMKFLGTKVNPFSSMKRMREGQLCKDVTSSPNMLSLLPHANQPPPAPQDLTSRIILKFMSLKTAWQQWKDSETEEG